MTDPDHEEIIAATGARSDTAERAGVDPAQAALEQAGGHLGAAACRALHQPGDGW